MVDATPREQPEPPKSLETGDPRAPAGRQRSTLQVHRAAGLAIAGLAVVLYLNILPNGFVFDDWQQIVDNPFLRRPDGLRKIFTTGVWQFLGPIGVTNFYRPAMHALFYGLFGLFQLDPAPYHFVSIALHAAVGLLAYAVVARLAGDRLIALVTALLFAAHPVHVEVVAWVSAYPELLCALFSLLAIWFYLAAEDSAGRKRIWLSVLTGPALLVALLSKEIAIAVPAFLLCYEIVIKRCRKLTAKTPRHQVKRSLCFFAMAVAIGIYLAARIYALGALMPAQSRKPVPAGEHFWTAVAVFYHYLTVQLAPVRLHAFYYLDRSHGPLELVVIAGLASIIATIVLAWWLWRRGRPEILAVVLYLLFLAPAFSLPYASVGLVMAERYAYLPSLGFCWLLAAALLAAGRRWNSRVALGVFLLIVIGYSARTVAANQDWRDDLVFYRKSMSDFPGFPGAYLNLGEALMRRGRMAEARGMIDTAIRLDPASADSHVNLGLIHRAQNEPERAADQFILAARLGREQNNRYVVSRALTNLAVVYRSTGRLDEAIDASRRALEADPNFAGACNNLGYALLLRGEMGEGKRYLQTAIQLDPAMDVAWSNLGLAAAMERQWPAALAFLRRAEQLNARSGEVQARIGEVYLAQGAAADARRQFQRALALDPGNERARTALRFLEQAQ